MRNVTRLINKQVDINGFLPQKTERTVANMQQSVSNESLETQKVFAQNLQSKGISIESNIIAKITEKTKIDELADKYFANFIKVFDGKTQEEAKAILIKILDGDDFAFIKAFSSNMRTIDEKIKTLQGLLGESNYRSLYFNFVTHYKKYIQNLLDDKNVSVEKLYSIRPDWTVDSLAKKLDFNNPFSIGEIPNNFISKEGYEKLILFLRDNNYSKADNIPDFVANGKTYKITALKKGQSKSGVFKLQNGEKEYVLKLGAPVTSDLDTLKRLNCKAYPNRTPFMDFYLTYNNCKNAPQLYYSTYNPDKKICSTLYEYIEGEGVNVPKLESDLADLKALKVNFTDTVGDDNIIYRNGTAYVVDNDNSYTSISSEISPWCQWVAGLFKNVCFN